MWIFLYFKCADVDFLYFNVQMFFSGPIQMCRCGFIDQQSRLRDHFLSLRPFTVVQSGETSCETWRLPRLLLRLSTNDKSSFCPRRRLFAAPALEFPPDNNFSCCMLCWGKHLLIKMKALPVVASLEKWQIIIFSPSQTICSFPNFPWRIGSFSKNSRETHNFYCYRLCWYKHLLINMKALAVVAS